MTNGVEPDTNPARPPLAERALSERVRTVPPSGIRRFFDILATMDDVISLGVGEPDFDTPRAIVEAGVREPARRPHPLHEQLRHDRAAARPGRSSRATLRRPLRLGHRDPHHGRRVGGGRSRPARDLRSGRRGDPPRALVRRVRARGRVRRRRRSARRHAVRGRLCARSRRGRGRDHAANEGPLPRLPVQSHGCRPARGRPGRARRDCRAARPAGVLGRDLRPAGVRRLTPIVR